jgi:hypothetical protein
MFIFVLNHYLMDPWFAILMMGSFFRKSHTTQREENVVANICWTCLFQAIDRTSSAGRLLAPGDIGDEGLFISQIKISESDAPEANKLC